MMLYGHLLMEKETINQPICRECGDKIKGRADKLFCNDSCRSAFNNRRNRTEVDPLRTINKVLSKNRKILKEAYETSGDSETIPLRRLENKGFVFNFYTHIEEPMTGSCYRYCYDFGYAEAKNGEVMISKYPGSYL